MLPSQPETNGTGKLTWAQRVILETCLHSRLRDVCESVEERSDGPARNASRELEAGRGRVDLDVRARVRFEGFVGEEDGDVGWDGVESA